MRPTSYKKRYCTDIIELAKQGYLPIVWSRELMVPKSTFHDWRGRYPEFSESWNIAKDIAESFIAERGLNGDSLDLNKAKFFLSAAFGVSEVQKQEVKQDISAKVETVEVSFGDRED